MKVKRIFLSNFAIVLGISVLINTVSAEAKGSSDIKTVVKGNTAFALDLYGKLKDAEGNLFFSPYSISTALAMTYAGARKNTATQMSQTLHFTLDRQRLHPAFAAMEERLNTVQKQGNVHLSIVNGIWPQKGYDFLKEYLALLKEHYGVSITPVDYKKATEAARKLINAWVEEKTKDKIKNIIQPGILNVLTRLVLVNAIYFKGNWASQFKKSFTKDASFWLAPGESIKVPTMTQKEKFGYAEYDNLQILELPYVGNELSMIVLLPKKTDGLAELQKNLTVENIEKWTKYLGEREVKVFLPRFKMTCQFDLNNTLMSMGMVDAFTKAKANFSGMDGREKWLYIGAVIHKAFVDVNEEGTEAAAATVVAMRAMAMPEPPPVVRADHPFLFLIRENSTRSILFIGRVVDPTKQ